MMRTAESLAQDVHIKKACRYWVSQEKGLFGITPGIIRPGAASGS